MSASSFDGSVFESFLVVRDETCEREQDPVLYDLESELMHDIYLPDSEITEEWWECRKHKYVQLHAHCELKDETTYITLPVAFEHEHATVDKQANIMAGLTPRGRPIKRNIRRFYTKLKNTAQPAKLIRNEQQHAFFKLQITDPNELQGY